MKKKNFLFLIIAITQIVFISPPLLSKPNLYAQGLQAESLGKIDLAIEQYEKAASEGLSDAKFALGRIYQDIYADDQKSFKWFIAAAKQGNAFAQYEVGMVYLLGSSITPINKKNAKEWFIKSANKGKVGKATYELFKLSTTDEEKQKWLLKSAEYGVLEAVRKLSDVYQTGAYGLTIDNDKAAYWQKEASRMEEQS